MFNTITFCGVLIFTICIVPNDGKLPTDVKPCKAGDKECIVETINRIIETKYNGDDELNLISIDPLKIVEMNVNQPKSSPVSIDLVFRNSEVHGYKNFRAYKVRGFGNNPKGKHEIFFKGPYASLIGDYSINGKILILPIRGDGPSNITMDEVFLRVNIIAESAIKNDVTYMDIKNVKLQLNATQVHFNFSNLFNGDKALGDNLNKFMNENWYDIYVELKQAVLDGFGIVYTDFLRKLFASHPYNELVEGGN